MSSFAFVVFPGAILATRPVSSVGRSFRCSTQGRPQTAVRAQLVGPPKPRPQPGSSGRGDGAGDGTGSASKADESSRSGQGESDEPSLRAPQDATPFRSESEVRRNQPAAREPRKRRRRGGDAEAVLEWDKMDTVPLVAGEDSVDGWVDLKASAQTARRRVESEQRLKESQENMEDALKDRLRQEVVRPYQQNWILWISLAVAMLAVAFKISGGFDAIPVIQVPDL
jgi:hypothetical protein